MGRRIFSGVHSVMSLQGVIFDLDGTLINSALDFNLICNDLGIPFRQPILEFLGTEAMIAEAERLAARGLTKEQIAYCLDFALIQ
jgi:phosphoglycolate phosphatase-like HAD superfamily hydrolase